MSPLYKVSLINDDLPLPLTPVTQVMTPNGNLTFTFLRLFSEAPTILINLPLPTTTTFTAPSGYSFYGWTSTSASTSKVATYTGNAAATFYALWGCAGNTYSCPGPFTKACGAKFLVSTPLKKAQKITA